MWKDKSPLLPSDPYQRAQARFWVDFVDKKVSYPSRKIVFVEAGEEQEECKKQLMEALKILEEELGDKTYFGGDKLGLVDVALITFYNWFYTVETFGKFSIEEECPKLMAWGKCCMEIESVSNSMPHPHKVYEDVSTYDRHFIYQRFFKGAHEQR